MRRYLQALAFPSAALIALVLAAPTKAAEESAPQEIPAALGDYIARPDPTFAWEVKEKADRSQGRDYRVELSSQKWQGIVWKHALHIHEPKKLEYPRHVLLFITGGASGRAPEADSILVGLQLAQLTGARVAVLHQVPNQPLLGNHVEDDLISETWLRYLATGDANWPLLFPMVKSAVRAMDAVAAMARQQWNGAIDGFVVSGASKRGWTTWLTAAVDKRVVAIAPIVIDMLNLRPQMQYQLETWGKFSAQIADYTRKGLVQTGDESPREAELRSMMDPYTYRSRLAMPKLLIHGTNDRYWVVDATQFYWDGLVGPKHLLKLPNAGHGLGEGRPLALSTLAAFFRHAADGTPLPALQWTHSQRGGELSLNVRSSAAPKAARLWTAHSPTKDFRDARWQCQPLEETDGAFAAQLPLPQRDHLAFFAELQFELRNLPYSLTTLVWRY
jgi:PhoPQ-activated pathogenicity-related protein